MQERVKKRLREILDGTKGGWYIGGSLDLGFCWVNTDGKVHWVEEKEDKCIQLDKETHRLVCELYVKYKTEKGAFYGICQEVLKRG